MKARVMGEKSGRTLSSAERKAMMQEIRRQIIENERQFEMDQEAAILWMLHEEFGFGKARLRRAWERMYEASGQLRAWYELEPEDDGWISRRKLREIGVDLEQWYKEAKDD